LQGEGTVKVQIYTLVKKTGDFIRLKYTTSMANNKISIVDVIADAGLVSVMYYLEAIEVLLRRFKNSTTNLHHHFLIAK